MDSNSGGFIAVDPDYEKFIEGLAKNSSDQTFTNSSEKHALTIVKSMFGHSKKHISIFTGALEDIYADQDLQFNVKNFLKSGGSLKILIQKDNFDPEKSGFISAINSFDEAIDLVEIKKASGNLFAGVKSHFLVADDKAYRIETDTQSRAAVGCFNDREMAQKLNNVFDRMFADQGACAVYPRH